MAGATSDDDGLRGGCYRILLTLGSVDYLGALRVEREAAGQVLASGDLYRFAAGTAPNPGFDIPILPRGRYHSFVRAIGIELTPDDEIALTLQQFDYTPPPVGTYTGRFPGSPGSRTARVVLARAVHPAPGWPGPVYEGTWTAAGSSIGEVTIGWVSPYFRRCTIEVDTVIGAVAPGAVPSADGSGEEDFRTVLASAGWDATVVYDRREIPKPGCVAAATDCWADACLHALMRAVRRPDTDLDREWRLHLLVVPGHITCSRGKMYDTIVVPREGVVTYCDDGYPAESSAWFGTAEGRTQRAVPRAYLRSAAHELVHGFNQIHQETEGGPDNSIMTTTPSVADVLRGATSGDPGIFPDGILLAVNPRVRRHLVHFPDPVVRPGGHGFATWTTGVLQADARLQVGPETLALTITCGAQRAKLGEPVPISWRLTNTGDDTVTVPSEITTSSLYARIAVLDADGSRREMAPFVIECEQTRLVPLEAGDSLTADSLVFWSTDGFAFERPGRHTIEVRVEWAVAGIPRVVRGSTEIFVDYPASDLDNAVAATLLDPEVGMWVALGGRAGHLGGAVERLAAARELVGRERPADGSINALRGFRDILPDG
jgi:hypothetical protein